MEQQHHLIYCLEWAQRKLSQRLSAFLLNGTMTQVLFVWVWRGGLRCFYIFWFRSFVFYSLYLQPNYRRYKPCKSIKCYRTYRKHLSCCYTCYSKTNTNSRSQQNSDKRAPKVANPTADPNKISLTTSHPLFPFA